MPQPAINIAIRGARAAARVLIRMLNRSEALSVVEKQRNDFVSEADHAAEKAIIFEIQKAYPDHAVLAEESGYSGPEDAETVWIIDPLDGTRNYIQGLPHFAISIGIKTRGKLEHALVYDPTREEMFTASRGSGAYLNDHRIRVSNRTSMEGALLATGFPFRAREALDDYMKMFRSVFAIAGDVRRAGSASLDLAYVAAGRVDGFWEIGLKPWDVAAGALLVREAGGLCTDFDGADGFLDSGNIIAGNLKLAGQMKKTISPLFTGPLKALSGSA
ncbi:MAG: inositol monophosphatase family protein [Pseudomonadota bacterium]